MHIKSIMQTRSQKNTTIVNFAKELNCSANETDVFHEICGRLVNPNATSGQQKHAFTIYVRFIKSLGREYRL